LSLNPPVKHNRVERVNKIKSLYKQFSNKSEWTAVLAKYCIEEGVSLRTAHEYLKLLREAGEIE